MTPGVRLEIDVLRTSIEQHALWNTPLLRACSAGLLSKHDFSQFFGQYYFYSKDFTRYLGALLGSCDNDLYRARLIENLWDESGGRDPSRRHAEMFRVFLREGLHLKLERLEPLPETTLFVRRYLEFCSTSHPAAASAFLALGTEGIVARMYGVFVKGLFRAGVGEQHLEFFRIHMACDDSHSATLEEIMASYASMPNWYAVCRDAVSHALELRKAFYEAVFAYIFGLPAAEHCDLKDGLASRARRVPLTNASRDEG